MSYGRPPSGLPQRPTAGSSNPRPPRQPPRQQPRQQHLQQPPNHPSAGAYTPYQALQLPVNPWHNATGGYPYPPPPPPSYPYQASPTYGHSLFQQPTATVTPDGYSYSPAYLSAHQVAPQGQTTNQPQAPPNKRPRPNPPAVAGPSSKAWRNCSYPGCKFVGAGEEVEIHEGDRHLIFPPGHVTEKSEEEERFAKTKGPEPFIQGTGIRLETAEDVAKWVAERKANYPSKQRIAEKEEERRAAIARGDRPDRGHGRGRGRGGAFGHRSDPASQAEDWGRVAPVAGNGTGGWSTTASQRGRGRGRGREGRGGGARITGGRETASSARGNMPLSEMVPHDQPPSAALPKVEVAPASGLVDYETSSESSSDESDSDAESSSSSSSDSVSSAPVDERGNAMVAMVPEKAPKHDRPVCKFFAKSGKCRLGDNCRFAHTEKAIETQGAVPPGDRRKLPRQPPAKKPNAFARPSMLGALLATPIRNTLSQLSQTIRFLVANDMLKGVELRPGEAEEKERNRNKVTVVDKLDPGPASALEQSTEGV